MDEIRLQLSLDINNPDWVRDFIVLHAIHEMKHAHVPSDESSESTLDRYLYDCGIHPDTFPTGEWYLDVGLEVTSRRRLCLQWMTSAHSVLAKEALRSIDDDDAASLTCFGADGYFRDVVNHLDEVSGFCFFPGSTRFPGGCKVVRAYTTDEDILGGDNAARCLTLKEVFQERFVQFLPTIETLIDTCVSARGEKPSKARLEVRVPLHHAHSVLLDVDPNFRLTRLLAINEALVGMSHFDTQLTPQNLTMTAALLWLVNGSLPSHPNYTPALYALLDAVLPQHYGSGPMGQLRTGDSPGSITHAAHQPRYIPFGCVFLRNLTHDARIPTFRRGDPVLPPDVFEALFGGMSMGSIESRYRGRQ
ncbi:hypothetical protein AGABI1DRAFT_125793 [Agaricus bisporus var. burnettii JB137-S8]|uniref:Uncharacterized protein n=1 Tax=Agaricus bisporus var. burnettii (strain JB137-S8 / ATCC MYA-4627 / FGSC 10392) TaxID=597362 RepID=K5XDI6_AGABU|nr:uncharacterized protein AGABI1DRAFT_125793 [Agaricus bisporus var. burnettii JB137-S8]EKM81403.1 hypothetical protein AGABI1DRAFT_125793 [Agaricus bisporus var. burnettii JB137-S8]